MAGNAAEDNYRAKALLYRELAERTDDPVLRRIHEKMARLYEMLASPEGKPGQNPPS